MSTKIGKRLVYIIISVLMLILGASTVYAASGTTVTVKLKMYVTDNLSGVKYMMISNRGDFSGASWQDYQDEVESWTLSNGEWKLISGQWQLDSSSNIRTVYVKYKDSAGNISDTVSNSINILSSDTLEKIVIANNEYYIKDENVSLVLPADSEVTKIRVGENNTVWGAWETYAAGTRSYKLSSTEGKKVIVIQIQDSKGVTYTRSSDLFLDKTTPSINSIKLSPTTQVSGVVNVIADFSDSGSGVSVKKWAYGKQSLEYFANSGTAIDGNNFTVSDNGYYTLFIKDAAGNAVIQYFEVNNIIKNSNTSDNTISRGTTGGGGAATAITAVTQQDQEGPTKCTVSVGDGRMTTADENIILKLKAEDASGVTEMMISNDPNFKDAVWEPYANEKNWKLDSGDGLKKVYVKFKDKLGNISSPVSCEITLNKTPIKQDAAKVVFVGVGHSPLIEGDNETFYLSSMNAKKVQYRVFLSSVEDGTTEELTKGYTEVMDSNAPYKFASNKAFKLGRYNLEVWVRAEGSQSQYDSTYTAYLNCVNRDDANRVYVNDNVKIVKDTYKVGEKVVVEGIDNLSGIPGPYKYRLHLYNATTDTWTKNVTEYADNIEWTPTEPGIYVLDIHVNTENSTTWKKYQENPSSEDVYGTYEAWKLKVIEVTN